MQHQGAHPGLWQGALTFWNNAFMLLSSVRPAPPGRHPPAFLDTQVSVGGGAGGQEGHGRVSVW